MSLKRHWKTNIFAKFLCENINVSMTLVATTMEPIGKTDKFYNFHDFWNYGLRALRVQNIIPEIMEIMEFCAPNSWKPLEKPIVIITSMISGTMARVQNAEDV